MKIPILPPGEIARRAVQAKESIQVAKRTRSVAKATDRTIKEAFGIEEEKKRRPEHGQQIFVFNHLQKNHVVYSLTRSMNNNAALAQLPFNGKKSVPTALRKDLWHPFAQIRFPPGAGTIGLSAFQKLREYRKRHELEWGNEILLDKDNKVRSLKERGKALCDQKANSVADMAAVLGRLAELEPLPEAKPKKEVPRRGQPGYDAEVWAKEKEARRVAEEEKAKRRKRVNIGLIGDGSGTQVEILWGNMQDAEFAHEWGPNVQHAPMPTPGPSGGKRLLKKREIAELIRGEIAAKAEYFEAEGERRVDMDDQRSESGYKPTAEDLEQEREERRAEIEAKLEEIKEEFKADERNVFLEAERKAAAAAKYARQVALEQRRIGASTFQGTAEEAQAAAEAAAAAVGITKGPVEKATPPHSTSRTKSTPSQQVSDPAAKQAKKQAARELYMRRQAEQAERMANDPEWYERVKAEGLQRKAEKGLLVQ
ncbi:hypothetical protein VTL71DRAFT_8378 [Oculimacula yallundae]|uniref:Large ribosomal subunit protein mL67 n=1 Tax=Oculimacula yallundae TaxID=86028 RepID=A0ABR4CXK2_9HELO